MNRINSFLSKLQPRKHKTQKEIDTQSIIGTNSDLPKYRILPNLRFAYALPIVIIFAGFGIHSIFFGKAATPPGTAHLWVAAGVNGSCTRASTPGAYNASTACPTIQAAANKAASCDTLVVKPGVYTDHTTSTTANTNTAAVTVPSSANGSASCKTTFAAETRWDKGSKVSIDGQFGARYGFNLSGASNIRVEGFEIYNFMPLANSNTDSAGVWAGTSSEIVGNNIHDIGGCLTTANDKGQVGIFLDSSNSLVDSNYIHDIGRSATSGCNPGDQAHDHGIYVNGQTPQSGNQISNNIFYNNKKGFAVQLYPGTIDSLKLVYNTFAENASANGTKPGNNIITGYGTTITNSTISNNIFYNSNGSTFKTIEMGNTLVVTNSEMKNNITSGNAMADNNTNLAKFTGGTTANQLSTIPTFANSAGNDYHLQASDTKAVNKALSPTTPTNSVTRDYDGNDRTAPHDIGAFEYIASSSSSCQPFNTYATFRDGNWPASCATPFVSTGPFNRAVPANPTLHPNSANIVNTLTGFGSPQPITVGEPISGDYQHPYYIATTADPIVTISLTTNWDGNNVNGRKIRIPKDAQVAGGGDGHITIVQPENDAAISSDVQGYSVGLYDALPKPSGGWVNGGTITATSGGKSHILTGTGVDAGNTTAASFNNLAGIIRAQEVEAGQINHALFGIVRCTDGSGILPNPKPTQTAAKCDGSNGYNAVATGGNSIPLGGRLWLNMTPSEIDALPSSVPNWKKIILKAIAQYGILIGDTGGYGGFDGGSKFSFGLQFESGLTYTSFGQTDKVADWAAKQGFTSKPSYMGLGTITDSAGTNIWTKLKVLDPCISMGTCPGTSDTTPPAVSVSAPSAGATVSGSSVTVTASAVDNTGGTGLSKVEFYDGTTLIGTDTSSPYSITWDTTSISNGSHSLTAKAYDNASPQNVATSSVITIAVSNTPPSSCSTKPGDTNNDSVVNITDIAEILKLYGQTNSTSCVDVNKDSVINISDIATVLQNYGK